MCSGCWLLLGLLALGLRYLFSPDSYNAWTGWAGRSVPSTTCRLAYFAARLHWGIGTRRRGALLLVLERQTCFSVGAAENAALPAAESNPALELGLADRRCFASTAGATSSLAHSTPVDDVPARAWNRRWPAPLLTRRPSGAPLPPAMRSGRGAGASDAGAGQGLSRWVLDGSCALGWCHGPVLIWRDLGPNKLAS